MTAPQRRRQLGIERPEVQQVGDQAEQVVDSQGSEDDYGVEVHQRSDQARSLCRIDSHKRRLEARTQGRVLRRLSEWSQGDMPDWV